MCGIAGIVDYSGVSNNLLLEKMRDSLIHRGPDTGGHCSWDDNGFTGLAHRRLAILDTSDLGNQPMHFQHLSLVFNGEIYNFRAVKSELVSLGHIFETTSDTEVVLHAFYEWGVEAVHKFKGMFAIALLNHESQQLFLFRDRFGVKPLYYFLNDKTFLFASELKAFYAHSAFEKTINHEALALFLLYGNVPAPSAIFEHTFKLSPGTYLQMDLRNLTFMLQNYWHPASSSSALMDEMHFESAKEVVKPLLVDSVMQRTVSDVPIGLFLSGGYDSATVAGILTAEIGALKTFTVSVPDAGLNEGPKAQAIASYLGTQHTQIDCSLDEAKRVIAQLPLIYDEPFADSSAIPTYLVSQEAVKSVKVALSADGGDELFGGYNRYRYYYKIPRWVRYVPTAAGPLIDRSIQALKWQGLKAQRMAKFAHLFGDFSLESYLNAMTQTMRVEQLRAYLKEPKIPNALPFFESNGPISTLMLNDTLNYLPNDILHKVDRATMAVGLEGREPLLDHDLYRAMSQLPDAFKCSSSDTKMLLKSIAHDYVPKSILDGPKKGFAIPINHWLRNSLSEELRFFASTEFLNSQGVFQAEAIQREVEFFLKGNDAKALFIWYFYSFQSWYQQWMR
jgi:asparagine synthase (glutamine-hydrolysing)